MATRISFDQAINELSEMFPNHSRETIERVLRQNKGRMETSITILLSLKPEHKKTSSSKPREQPQRPAPQAPEQHHIFPSDYLRWPKNVNYIKVSTAESNSLIEPNDMLSSFNTTPESGSGKMKTLSVEDFMSSPNEHGLSAWESLKKKFIPESSYDQL